MNYNTSDYFNLVFYNLISQLWKIDFVLQNFRDSDSDSTWKILIDSDSAQNLAIPPIPESIPIPHHCWLLCCMKLIIREILNNFEMGRPLKQGYFRGVPGFWGSKSKISESMEQFENWLPGMWNREIFSRFRVRFRFCGSRFWFRFHFQNFAIPIPIPLQNFEVLFSRKMALF